MSNLYLRSTVVLIGGGACGAAAGACWPEWPFAHFVGGVLLTAAGWAAYTDLARHKILNVVTYPAAALALGVNLLASATGRVGETGGLRFAPVFEAFPLGAVGAGYSFVGLLAGFVGMLLAFRLAGGGAGDVKLAAAIGAAVGPRHLLGVLVVAYLFAAAVGVSRAVLRHGPVRMLFATGRTAGAVAVPALVTVGEEDRALLREGVPMAPAFAAALVVVLTAL